MADGLLRVATYVMDEEAAQAVSVLHSELEEHSLGVIVSGECVSYWGSNQHIHVLCSILSGSAIVMYRDYLIFLKSLS